MKGMIAMLGPQEVLVRNKYLSGEDKIFAKISEEIDQKLESSGSIYEDEFGQYIWVGIVGEYSKDVRDQVVAAYQKNGWGKITHCTSSEKSQRAGLTTFRFYIPNQVSETKEDISTKESFKIVSENAIDDEDEVVEVEVWVDFKVTDVMFEIPVKKSDYALKAWETNREGCIKNSVASFIRNNMCVRLNDTEEIEVFR